MKIYKNKLNSIKRTNILVIYHLFCLYIQPQLTLALDYYVIYSRKSWGAFMHVGYKEYRC